MKFKTAGHVLMFAFGAFCVGVWAHSIVLSLGVVFIGVSVVTPPDDVNRIG